MKPMAFPDGYVRQHRIFVLAVVLFALGLIVVGRLVYEVAPLSPLAVPAARMAHFNVFIPVAYKETFGLVNGDFEGGATGDQLYWDQFGGPYVGEFVEIRAPTGWTAYWIQGVEGICVGGYNPGRPEYNVFENWMDPRRVYSGTQSARYFTFWRCQSAGLLQGVHLYGIRQASVEVQAWYSNCSTKPYDLPLDYNCSSPLDAHLKVRIGIDPTGVVDPHSEHIVWSEWAESYGEYKRIFTLHVSLNGPATVFLQSLSDWPLKHEDVYWDWVVLE